MAHEARHRRGDAIGSGLISNPRSPSRREPLSDSWQRSGHRRPSPRKCASPALAAPQTRSDCAQHQKELPTARLDLRRHRELRREPGQPIHEPYGGLLGFRPTGAAGHHLSAALAGQPLDGRHDRGRLHDEQLGRPGHDGLDRALARVTGPVGKALRARGSLLALRRSAAVDAWAAVCVDGRVGVDRLIA